MFGEMLGPVAACRPGTIRAAPTAAAGGAGPGRGTLMADALRAAQGGAGIPGRPGGGAGRSQPGAAGTCRQKNSKDCGAAVRWADAFRRQPAGPAAVPAGQRIFRRPAGPPICEDRARLVRAHGDGEGWRAGFRAGARCRCRRPPIPPDRDAAPEGGVYETSPAATALAEEIARAIAAQRRRGADHRLRLWRRARASAKPCRRWAAIASPMCWPSPAKTICPPMSISPRWRQPARRGGAAVSGPRDQGEFLADLGIAERAGTVDEGQSRRGADPAGRAPSG